MFDHWKAKHKKEVSNEDVARALYYVGDALSDLANKVNTLITRDSYMENTLKQSTTDVVNAVSDLGKTITTIVPLIDAAIAAQSSGDDDALEAAVTQLGSFKQTLIDHSKVVAATVTGAISAPADADPAAAASLNSIASSTAPSAPPASTGTPAAPASAAAPATPDTPTAPVTPPTSATS